MVPLPVPPVPPVIETTPPPVAVHGTVFGATTARVAGELDKMPTAGTGIGVVLTLQAAAAGLCVKFTVTGEVPHAGPEIVIVALFVAEPVLGFALYVIVPLAVPLPPLWIVSQDALD